MSLIFKFLFILLLNSFLLSQATALEIKVRLPKTQKTLPLEIKQMLFNLKAIIPPQVSKILNHKIILDFVEKTTALNIQCPKDLIKQYNIDTKLSEIEEVGPPLENLNHNNVEVPTLISQFSYAPKNLIIVNTHFLQTQKSLAPCYQSANYFSRTDYLEGQILRSIGQIWNRTAKVKSIFLRKQNRLKQFSDSSLFAHLDNWGSGVDKNINKNVWDGGKLKLVAPAVRISALQNFSQEHSFIIYFEKFLNDKNFSCKKPAVYMYFKKIMGFTPFGIKECADLNHTIYGGFLNKDSFNLDPSKIIEIQILLAGPGKSAMSRWGHTMFRLVVCKEGQNKSECIKDSLDDIILGFRAYVGDLKINPIKGLFGQYPSLIFPAKMADIKKEYNRDNLRDLTSIPINFTKEEIKFFLYKVIQNFWSYRGQYYFLTNNCATESNDFLMGSFLSSPKKSQALSQLLGSTLTPTGSIKDIRKTKSDSRYKVLKNTFDLTKLQTKNKKRNKNYIYLSYRPALKKLISLLNANVKKTTSAKKINNSVEVFANLSTKERVKLYQTLLDKQPRYAIALTLLENYIHKILRDSIRSNALSMAIEVNKPGPLAKNVLDAFKKVTRSHIQIYRFNSYGVPNWAKTSVALKQLTIKYGRVKKSEMINPNIDLIEGAIWNWKDELLERSQKLAQKIFPEWSKELREIDNLIKSLESYAEHKKLSF